MEKRSGVMGGKRGMAKGGKKEEGYKWEKWGELRVGKGGGLWVGEKGEGYGWEKVNGYR